MSSGMILPMIKRPAPQKVLIEKLVSQSHAMRPGFNMRHF